jgi:membrane-associated phospholipid phosphatase
MAVRRSREFEVPTWLALGFWVSVVACSAVIAFVHGLAAGIAGAVILLALAAAAGYVLRACERQPNVNE